MCKFAHIKKFKIITLYFFFKQNSKFVLKCTFYIKYIKNLIKNIFFNFFLLLIVLTCAMLHMLDKSLLDIQYSDKMCLNMSFNDK